MPALTTAYQSDLKKITGDCGHYQQHRYQGLKAAT